MHEDALRQLGLRMHIVSHNIRCTHFPSDIQELHSLTDSVQVLQADADKHARIIDVAPDAVGQVDVLHGLARQLAVQANINLAKWGKQDFSVLGLAVGEEAGELAQAILKNKFEAGDVDRIRQEAIDLGALCVQVMKHFEGGKRT